MKSMLIVDDEPKVVQGLMDHVDWTEFGIRIQDFAYNGEEAWAKIQADPPDMVITDIYMPKMDGLELIERIRESYPSIYLIIHSGYDDFENARRAMRLGVQHFFYKPSTVKEIKSVMLEIVQELEVQHKRQKLLEQYDEQLKAHMVHMKEALLRELLTTRYHASDVPREKMELLQLPADAEVVVASLSLIRPPYVTKSKEREWQLMKFGAGNIIQETIQKHASQREAEIHAVNYSDTVFVLVFAALRDGRDLARISRAVAEEIVSHILLYLRLSSSAGIGRVKTGAHELIDSFLESQRALEAAEYEEINKVYLFEDVFGDERRQAIQYPLETLKQMQEAIERKEFDRLASLWEAFERQAADRRMPLVLLQTACVSLVGSIMMGNQLTDPDADDNGAAAAGWIQDLYRNASTMELCKWMKGFMDEWVSRMKKEVTSRKSNKLIQAVKDHVAAYYDKEITLAEIADTLYVNRNYLSQLFKRVTGETFVTYLNKYRVELAKQKLKEGRYMIYEISEMVGYQNPTYFSQVFKSITGVSPSEYY